MTEFLENIDKKEIKNLKKRKFPNWMNPMLATLTHQYFSDEEWIYERKLDGERCLIFKNGKNIRIMSRNKKKLNHVYPEIAEAIKKQREENFIIDGEMVAFEGNITSFPRLQNRMHLSTEKEAKESSVPVFFYVFDILYFDEYDVTKLMLRTRKSLLKNSIPFKDPLRFLAHINKDGVKYFKDACKKKWEGLVAKKADSPYKHSRSGDWLKFKCSNQQEFIIIGYTNPRGERIGFGALLIGYYKSKTLKYAGKVGTGFNDKMLYQLSKKLSRIERKTPPLEEDVHGKNIHWVKPELVGEVGFTEWTKDGKLRHPRFMGLRRDKNPKDVVREDKG